MTDQEVEQEIIDKGLTAPRVTLETIQSNIAHEYYFTAAQGVLGESIARDGGLTAVHTHPSMELLTFCVLVLKNGFTIVGKSAVASAENFDADLGRKIARKNAVDKIWPLMGFALKQRMAEQTA